MEKVSLFLPLTLFQTKLIICFFVKPFKRKLGVDGFVCSIIWILWFHFQETERNSNLFRFNFQGVLVQHLSYLAKSPGHNSVCYNKTEKDKGLYTLNSTFPKKGHKPNTTDREMQSALCRPRQELLQYYLSPSSSP